MRSGNIMEILEALSVQWSEKTGGLELIDSVDNTVKDELMGYYINSLYWRSPELIKPRTIELVKELIHDDRFSLKVYNLLFELATRDDHPLNATFTHKLLESFSMVDRDSFFALMTGKSFSNWSEKIDKDSPVYKLTNVRNCIQSDHLSTNTTFLWATMISWFLSSTNRRIRDRATKSLTVLLKNKPEIVLNLLEKFQTCDDEYITERILVAIYGAFLLNPSSEYLSEVSKFLYSFYYENGKIPYNVSIRDHARLIIELALKICPEFKITDYQIIETPASTNDKFIRFDMKEEIPDISYEKHPNLHIGRMFGAPTEPSDFAKYIVKPHIESIIGELSDEKLLVIYNGIFASIVGFDNPGYNNNCAKFDHMILDKFGAFRTRPVWSERLGKKYSWVVFKQLLGLLYDKRNSKADDNKFTGLQSYNLRDIDPTDLRLQLADLESNINDFSAKSYNLPTKSVSIDKWCNSMDSGNIIPYFSVINSADEQYFPLYMTNNWIDQNRKDENKAYGCVNMTFNSIIIDSSNFEQLTCEFKKGNSELFSIGSDSKSYLGEWSDRGLNSYYSKEFNELSIELNDLKFHRLAQFLTRGSEWVTDCSSSNSIPPLIVPSPKLIEFGNLSWDVSGGWQNSEGKIEIQDTWWDHSSPITGLVCSRKFIEDYLKQTGKILAVFCIEEKNIRGFHGEYKAKIRETLVKLQDGKLMKVKWKTKSENRL